MNIIRKIKYTWNDLKKIYQINKCLPGIIKDSGIQNGLSYIKLTNNKIFYGPRNNSGFKYSFLLLPKIRRYVSNESSYILFDIIKRYKVPNKKRDVKYGKYYNFNKDDVILELGAYIGYYAIGISELLSDQGKIIAVEASPDNFKILNKNISENKINNIIPLHKAIWNKKTELDFYLTENQKNSVNKYIVGDNESIKVSADTVDNIVKDLNLTKIDFVRIQLNGVEYEALQGMSNVLINKKPKLLIAVPYINDEIIKKFLESHGYTYIMQRRNIFAYYNN